MSNCQASGETVGLLYREFEVYYQKQRCVWSPENPRRIFNLCMNHIYPTYRQRLSREEFLTIMYLTLGVHPAPPPQRENRTRDQACSTPSTLTGTLADYRWKTTS